MFSSLTPPPFGRTVAPDAATPSILTPLFNACSSRSTELHTARLRSNFWPAIALVALFGCAPAAIFGEHHHNHGASGAGDPLSALACSSNALTGAATDACTITVTNPAGKAGVVVSLSSSSTSLAVPASVTVPSGASSVSFTATAAAVSAAQTATLTAEDSDSRQTFAVQLNAAAAPAGVLSSITCGSASLGGAATDACTLTLTGAAASGGLIVSLASSDSALKVPASVTVASGASSVGFSATASAVSSSQTATLSAISGSVTKTFAVQLGPATPGLTLTSTSVNFGSIPVKTAATQSVTLASSGTAPVTVSAARLTGTGFTMAGMTAPMTLSPGQTTTVSVQFDPTAAGTDTGTLTISSNSASGATATVALSGTGAASTSYQVGLSWDAPSGSSAAVSGYHIYRALSGGSFALLNSSVSAGTTYTDTAVQAGSTYNYEVTSVDSAGVESAPSGVYTASIP